MDKINEIEFFHRAVVCICGSLNIHTVISDCLELFTRYIPVDGISVSIIRDNNQLTFISSKTKQDFKYRIPKTTIELDQDALKYIYNLLDSPVYVVKDMAKDPACRHVIEKMGNPDLSGIVLTLKTEGNIIGNVTVMAEGLNRYDKSHTSLLTLLREPFALALSNTLKHQELEHFRDLLVDDNRYLNNEIRKMTGNEVIGHDKGLKEVMTMVHQVAPLSNQVLILGETGVGKEVIANAIHYNSPRADNPFVKVNCGAIPESLIDSELFGYEKGAFTGATSRKRGRFERANKGTVFLDEIGELPLQAQVRLLRVLQNKEIERVGGDRVVPLDIRIIAATHRNLAEMVDKKQFREDLWYRLNVFPIFIPPLRHRKIDIPEMVNYFISKKAEEMNIEAIPSLNSEILKQFQDYNWPGNVRELENVVERALIRKTFTKAGEWDQIKDIQPDKNDNHVPEETENLNLDDKIKDHIEYVLKMTHGKIYGEKGAAAVLGVHPSTLRNRMDKLSINYKKQKKI